MKRVVSLLLTAVLVFGMISINEANDTGKGPGEVKPPDDFYVEESDEVAEYILTTDVAAHNPERFGMNFDGDVQINNYIDDSSFEPIILRNSHWAAGDGTDSDGYYIEGKMLSRYDSFTDGFYDGATARVYRFVQSESMRFVLKGTIKKHITETYNQDGSVSEEGRLYLENIEWTDGLEPTNGTVLDGDYIFIDMKEKENIEIEKISQRLGYAWEIGGEPWEYTQRNLDNTYDMWRGRNFIYHLGENEWISKRNFSVDWSTDDYYKQTGRDPQWPIDDQFGSDSWHETNWMVKYGDNKRVRYYDEDFSVDLNDYFNNLRVDRPTSVDEKFGKTFLRLENKISHPESGVGIWNYKFSAPSELPGRYLTPGVKYTVDLWLRTEVGTKDVEFSLNNLGDLTLVEANCDAEAVNDTEYPIQRYINFKNVDTTWRKYSATFTVGQYPGVGSTCGVRFRGEGIVYIDNVNLYEKAYPDGSPGEYKVNEMSPTDWHELTENKYGSLRIWHAHNNGQGGASMSDSLDFPNLKSAITITDGATNGRNFKIPESLNLCLNTGESEAERTNPWLIIGPFMDENEWRDLVAYLAGSGSLSADDYDGNKAGTVHPYVKRRQEHLNYFGIDQLTSGENEFRWIDQFEKIYIEVSNETWNWGFGWFMEGERYGQLARYFLEEMKKSPYYEDLVSKLIFVINGHFTGEFGKEAVRSLLKNTARTTGKPDPIFMMDSTTYIGGWEAGEFVGGPSLINNGFRELLAYPYAVGNKNSDKIAKQCEDIVAELADDPEFSGDPPKVLAGIYEGGPSYDHPSPSNPFDDLAEKYGKSIAAAVATLEENLYCSYNGYASQAFFAYGPGINWKSHSSQGTGFMQHATTMALNLRNNYVTGDMTKKIEIYTPTIDFKTIAGKNGDKNVGVEKEYTNMPLSSVYSFYDKEKETFSVFVLSNKTYNKTKVRLYLPFSERPDSIMLYKLAGKDGSPLPPYANNMGKQRMRDDGTQNTNTYWAEWANQWITEILPLEDEWETGQMIHLISRELELNDSEGMLNDGVFELEIDPSTVFCYVFEGVTMKSTNKTTAYLARDSMQKSLTAEPIAEFNIIFSNSTTKVGEKGIIEFIRDNIIINESGANPQLIDIKSISDDNQRYRISLSDFRYEGEVKVDFSSDFKEEFDCIVSSDTVFYKFESRMFFYEDFNINKATVTYNSGKKSAGRMPNGNSMWSELDSTSERNYILNKDDPDYNMLWYPTLLTHGNYVSTGVDSGLYDTPFIKLDLTSKLLTSYVDVRKVFNRLENNRQGALVDTKLIGKAGTSVWISALMRKDDISQKGGSGTSANNDFGLFLSNSVENRNVLEFGCLGAMSSPQFWKETESGKFESIHGAHDYPPFEFYWTLRLRELQPAPHEYEAYVRDFPNDGTKVVRTKKRVIPGETIFVAINIKFNLFENGDEVFVYINPPLSGTLPEPDAYIKTAWPVLHQTVNTVGEITNFSEPYERSLAFQSIGYFLGQVDPFYEIERLASISEIRIGNSLKGVTPQVKPVFEPVYAADGNSIEGIRISDIEYAKFDDSLIFVVTQGKKQVDFRTASFKVEEEAEVLYTFAQPLIIPPDGKLEAFIWKGSINSMIPLYEKPFSVSQAGS